MEKKQYWQDFYSCELQNLQDVLVEGSDEQLSTTAGLTIADNPVLAKTEEWFEDETEKVVDWICEHVDDECKSLASVVDLGSGNGVFLLRLQEKGYTSLFGCDFVETAVSVARVLSRKVNGNGAGPLFEVMDIRDSYDRLAEKFCGNEEMPVSNQICTSGGFDIIHDKGTFDVFWMLGDTSGYKQSLRKFVPEGGNKFFLTSCNATLSELRHIFCCSTTVGGLSFEFIQECPHRSFMFGGKQGTTVTSVFFKTTKT
eukprot:Lankesteria_metandrocarpae@DN1420_c0_g1_i4.p1